jgi:uncharacterized membrane protein YcaP (DUF421 family)
MPQWLSEPVRALLGLEKDIADVNAAQMALRAVIVYAVTLVIVRLGSKRLLSKATAFDFIVAIMLGSIMSRAINGSAPFFPTLAAGALLLGIHWLFALLAFHTEWFGSVVKGRRVLLIKDGQVQQDGVRRASITAEDLDQALRLHTKQADPSKVQRAYLERNGQISVVPYPREPQVISVPVEDGVQTVRIELQ